VTVTVAFGAQAEKKRDQNKCNRPFFLGRKNEKFAMSLFLNLGGLFQFSLLLLILLLVNEDTEAS
jgi:hypothetical protein